MSVSVWWVVLAVIVGAVMGGVVMSLCAAARCGDCLVNHDILDKG